MTNLLAWLPPAVLRLLGWVLLHFLWQGLVLAAVFAGLMGVFRNATKRYALAVSVLALMLAAPIATFLYLQQTPNLPLAQAGSFAPAIATNPARSTPASPPREQSQPGISPDTFLWLLRAWMAGVIFFTLRTAGGILVVERLQRRKASPVAPRLLQICLDLQRRLGIQRSVRFCQCNGLDVPAVIGWFRPIVLLPMTVLTGLSATQLEAVIAHELAHIRRWDYFVNFLQIVAETLLFYHPAVWWVSHRIRLERENCCDDMAVLVCGNVVDYARALTFMEGGRTAPSLVMAANGSPLSKRVLRLLDTRKSGSSAFGIGLAIAALCLAAAVFMSQAFVRVAHADANSAAAPDTTTVAPSRTTGFASHAMAAAQPLFRVVQLPSVAKTPIAVAPVLISQAASSPIPATTDQPNVHESYIDSLKAVGLDHLSADDLVAMKIPGVTADYVRELHDMGLKPSPDDLIALRIQGVTPQYIREMRAHGIDAGADDLVAMKIQGVTPEYVQSLQDLGLKPGADDLVAMKIQGVTPEYVQSLQDLGLKPGADDLVAMRVQRVTPEFIRDIRALGLNPGADDLIAMQVQGVTPDYIKAMTAAGVSKGSADDYISAKVQGVTPEFVEKARRHGFQDLSLDQLIELKHVGVL